MVGAYGAPSAIPEKRSQRTARMRRPSISLLTKLRKPSINDITGGRIEGTQEYGPGCPSSCNAITPEFAYPSVPKPESADDLLQAAALIWAPRDAISMVHVPFLERLPLGPQN